MIHSAEEDANENNKKDKTEIIKNSCEEKTTSPSQDNDEIVTDVSSLTSKSNEKGLLYGFPLSFGKLSRSTSQKKPQQTAKTTLPLETDDSSDTLLLQSLIRKGKKNNADITTKPPLPSLIPEENKITAKDITEEDITEDKDYNKKTNQTVYPEKFVPSSSTVSFQAHSKTVSCLALNLKGSRLTTGSHDSEVRLWDFNGMTSSPAPFRQFIPIGGHGIRALSYSSTGSHFACAAGDAICRVYDSDGKKLHETVKGDMYVRDLSQTKGHTHAINDCEWHPIDKSKFLTGSTDATLRIFDISSKPYGVDQALAHIHILKAVDKRNLNIAGQCRVTACRWAPTTAKFIVGSCSDGSIQLWNSKKIFGRPDQVVRPTHAEHREITSLVVLKNEEALLSRSTDGTVKLWDIRKFKSPVHTWEGLPWEYTGNNMCIDPSESLVVVGTSSPTESASLKIFSLDPPYEEHLELELQKQVGSETRQQGSSSATSIYAITSVVWPESLNQLIVGGSDGFVHIFYDTEASDKGALLFVNRPAVSKHQALEGFQVPIFTPDNLPPGFRQTRTGEIRRVRHMFARGKVKAAVYPQERSTLASSGMPSTMLGQLNQQDPVEALRAYSKVAEEEPIFVTTAYTKTQPVPILDYTPQEGDDEKLVESVSKCPRCGLKLCQCGYMRLKGPDILKMRRLNP